MAASQMAIAVAKPASATDWAYTVPGGYSGGGVYVISVSALYVASATANSRQPALQFLTPAGGTIGSYGINAALIASQSARYTFGMGLPAMAAIVNSTVSPSTFPLPQGLWVPAGGIIQVVTAALTAGDQWSDIVLILSN